MACINTPTPGQDEAVIQFLVSAIFSGTWMSAFLKALHKMIILCKGLDTEVDLIIYA